MNQEEPTVETKANCTERRDLMNMFYRTQPVGTPLPPTDGTPSSPSPFKDDELKMRRPSDVIPIARPQVVMQNLDDPDTDGIAIGKPVENMQDQQHLQLQGVEGVNPLCKRFFILFRFLGTLTMVSTLVGDFIYLFK